MRGVGSAAHLLPLFGFQQGMFREPSQAVVGARGVFISSTTSKNDKVRVRERDAVTSVSKKTHTTSFHPDLGGFRVQSLGQWPARLQRLQPSPDGFRNPLTRGSRAEERWGLGKVRLRSRSRASKNLTAGPEVL